MSFSLQVYGCPLDNYISILSYLATSLPLAHRQPKFWMLAGTLISLTSCKSCLIIIDVCFTFSFQSGFDMLHSLVPSLSQNPNSKVSKAQMLQKGMFKQVNIFLNAQHNHQFQRYLSVSFKENLIGNIRYWWYGWLIVRNHSYL